jgi:hypothetical protein
MYCLVVYRFIVFMVVHMTSAVDRAEVIGVMVIFRMIMVVRFSTVNRPAANTTPGHISIFSEQLRQSVIVWPGSNNSVSNESFVFKNRSESSPMNGGAVL